jgi:hypothetical protein
MALFHREIGKNANLWSCRAGHANGEAGRKSRVRGPFAGTRSQGLKGHLMPNAIHPSNGSNDLDWNQLDRHGQCYTPTLHGGMRSVLWRWCAPTQVNEWQMFVAKILHSAQKWSVDGV